MSEEELELLKRTVHDLCGVTLRLQVDMAGKSDLRDQFAMAALPALIGLHRADLRWKDCAPEAYKLADAMMEARK